MIDAVVGIFSLGIGFCVVWRVLSLLGNFHQWTRKTTVGSRGKPGTNSQSDFKQDEAARTENAKRQAEAREREWREQYAKRQREKEQERRNRGKNGWSDQGQAKTNGYREPRAWHAVLGVPAEASSEEIRLAYRRKIKDYHPDRLASLGEDFRLLAEEHCKEINEAYQFISKLREA